MIEQGIMAAAAFGAVNWTIDSTAKLKYFLTASRARVKK
jgi:hypothetical protein